MEFTLEQTTSWVIVRYPGSGQIAFRHDGDMEGAVAALDGVVKAMGFVLAKPEDDGTILVTPEPDATEPPADGGTDTGDGDTSEGQGAFNPDNDTNTGADQEPDA